jgi:hypothetical protein
MDLMGVSTGLPAAFIRMPPGAEIGRLAFEILGGSQPRFPYPVAAGVLSIRPMPGGEFFQFLDRADCDCSHFAEPHAWLSLHNFDPRSIDRISAVRPYPLRQPPTAAFDPRNAAKTR